MTAPPDTVLLDVIDRAIETIVRLRETMAEEQRGSAPRVEPRFRAGAERRHAAAASPSSLRVVRID